MTEFSIITPTFKRPDELRRALKSLLDQDYQLWEVVVVNDSPQYQGYVEIEKEFTDSRIKFLQNSENVGANASRNHGLQHISSTSGWIIFLDDDDWLAPGALSSLRKLMSEYPNEQWLLTNRVDEISGKKTNAPQNQRHYTYAWDYLISKKITGDATHCINAKTATTIRFPTLIKNGEEWLYFFSLGQSLSPFYTNIDTTLTKGYTLTGLNFRKRNFLAQLHTIKLLLSEGSKRGVLINFYFILYILMRLVRSFIK